MTWFMSMVRTLFLNIDRLIVAINSYLFELFYGLTKIRFTNSYLFDKLANRLYIIIGIFMLFRVVFALIQMLADPDKVSDKEKGMGKLLTRIVVSLALLIVTPFVFEKAMDLQSAILDDRLIEQVILGVNTNVNDTIGSQGKQLAYEVFKGFVFPNDEAEKDELYKACEANHGINHSSINELILLDSENPDSANCLTDATSNNEFPYTYLFVASPIAGIILAWMVVGFCIDIATRLIKLGFYQIIAPIPIMSYITGDKNSPFYAWIKKCISAYISVFIKLLIIYFMIYMCSIILRSGTNINEEFDDASFGIYALANVALILGLIVFAKIAPNLIKDMFGIKDDSDEGGFVKTLAKTALLGGAGMLAAGASNFAFGLGNTFDAFRKKGAKEGFKNFGKTLFSTVGGGASGLRHGVINGYNNKGANPFSGLGKTVLQSNQARYNRSKMWAATEGEGSNFLSRAARYYGGTARDVVLGRTGLDTTVGNREKTLKNKLAGIQSARQANAQAKYRLLETAGFSSDTINRLNDFSYDSFKNRWYRTEMSADGKVEINELPDNIKTAADVANYAGLAGNVDAEQYLNYTRQDGLFNRGEVELNKQLGVVGQVKDRREGKLN